MYCSNCVLDYVSSHSLFKIIGIGVSEDFDLAQQQGKVAAEWYLSFLSIFLFFCSK